MEGHVEEDLNVMVVTYKQEIRWEWRKGSQGPKRTVMLKKKRKKKTQKKNE